MNLYPPTQLAGILRSDLHTLRVKLKKHGFAPVTSYTSRGGKVYETYSEEAHAAVLEWRAERVAREEARKAQLAAGKPRRARSYDVADGIVRLDGQIALLLARVGELQESLKVLTEKKGT